MNSVFKFILKLLPLTLVEYFIRVKVRQKKLLDGSNELFCNKTYLHRTQTEFNKIMQRIQPIARKILNVP